MFRFDLLECFLTVDLPICEGRIHGSSEYVVPLECPSPLLVEVVNLESAVGRHTNYCKSAADDTRKTRTSSGFTYNDGWMGATSTPTT